MPRNDFGKQAEQYYQAIDESLFAVAQAVRELILAAIPNATETIKWGVPVYEQNGLICAVRTTDSHVALQFFDIGTSLKDPDKLLEGTGKTARHVKIRKLSDIKKRTFSAWLKQSAKSKSQR